MQKFLFLIYALLASCSPKINTSPTAITKVFDWQGHRGARGLAPENTIPAFLKGLELGVHTLELDLAVSADNQLVISHEPWMDSGICSHPDGSPVTMKESEKLLIHQMTYDSIQKYDCGIRGNARFPQQQKKAVAKPTFSAMVAAVKKYCKDHRRELPFFNVEIKSKPDWDLKATPSVPEFAALALQEINRLGIHAKACIQSFDPRALEVVHRLDKNITTALLIENPGTLEKNLATISFTPAIYSPYYKLIGEKDVQACHAKNILVIPWTVNERADMDALIKMGVDGMITDYPDRANIITGK